MLECDDLHEVTGIAECVDTTHQEAKERQAFSLLQCREYAAFLYLRHHKSGYFANAIRWALYATEYCLGYTTAATQLFDFPNDVVEHHAAAELGEEIRRRFQLARAS